MLKTDEGGKGTSEKQKPSKKKVRQKPTDEKHVVVQEVTSENLREQGEQQNTKQPKKRRAKETQESSHKKRKTLDRSAPLALPATTEPPPLAMDNYNDHAESPEKIQELQAQVKDIIHSASSLAKAARTRAFSGKKKSSLVKKSHQGPKS